MKLIAGCIIIAALLAGYWLLDGRAAPDESRVSGYRDAAYVIEGERLTLGGAARYFGNELHTDLDGDGREDVAFVITHSPGGSGTFYYAVAALNTPDGWIGSDGYFLGDRIAPQSTDESPNPRHERVVVFDYADRAEGEPMSAQPSVGKSAYLKLDADSMRWAVVEPDFEGEAR